MRTFLGLACLALGYGATAKAWAERWTQYANTGDITGMADAGDRIWLGTQGGLLRIEKASAETAYFDQANSSLTDLRIQTVASDGKGSVAAVTWHGGLAVFDGRAWTNPGMETPLRGQYCLDAVWDAAGSFWVLATDPESSLPSLFRKRGSQWNRFYLDAVDRMSGDGYGGYGYSAYLPASIRHPSLQADRQGRVWASVLNHLKTKVFRINPDGSMDTLGAPAGGLYNQLVVTDSGAPVWLGPWGMVRAGGSDTLKLPVSGSLINYSLSARNRFARAADGSELWSFDLDKIHRRRSCVWDTLSLTPSGAYYPPFLLPAGDREVPGLPAPYAYVSAGGRFGTLAADAWAFANVTKTAFLARSGLTLFPGRPGTSAMLLRSLSGVEAFDSRSGAFDSIYSVPPGGQLLPTSLFADRSGRIWASGLGIMGVLRNGGLEILKPADGRWFGTAASAFGMNSFMAEDPEGTLWFADSSRLLSSPEGNEDTRNWIEHPLPAPWTGKARISAIAGHKDGSIWIAALGASADFTAGIAARYDGKNWTVHDQLSNVAFPSRDILDLLCDGAGDVWLRYHDGLLQWNGTAWIEHLWSSSPLLGKGIVAMAVDRSGALWAATAAPETSLLRWSGAEGWQSVADAAAKLRTTPVRNMAFDAEGKLWISSDQDGLMVFDPASAPVSGIARPRTAARARSALSRPSEGSWRIVLPGSQAGGPGLSARILDIRGRTIPLRRNFP